MDEETVRLVIDQMAELQAEHPNFELALTPSGELVVRGTVGFRIEHQARTVEDEYEIELILPSDYPDSPPTTRESGGAIPDAFHKFPKSGNLCLAAPVELRRIFARHKTLLGFVNRQLIPYLFSYSYKRDYGELPHGELSHGLLGLLEYYGDVFGTGFIGTMKLLKLLADGSAPPLMNCPCNSGKKLQDCHGPKLDELRPHHSPEAFAAELRELVDAARGADIRLPERDVLPQRTWKRREKRRRKKKAKR